MGQIVAEFMEYWGEGRDPANSSHSLKPQGAQYGSNRGVSRLETAPGAPAELWCSSELGQQGAKLRQNSWNLGAKEWTRPIPALLRPGEGAQGSPASNASLESAPGGPVGLSSAAEGQNDGVFAQHKLSRRTQNQLFQGDSSQPKQ